MICKTCVLDSSVKSLTFINGECHFCRDYVPLLEKKRNENKNGNKLLNVFKRISKVNSKYNCLIGVSGGVDSSYLVYLSKLYNLRPLLLHFDNGWNSELAVSNIKKISHKCNFDLETYVVNWKEFKEIQRSFIKSSVIDIELVTDHAIFANLIRTAKRKKIKYILSGTNLFTEHAMPREWIWRKTDFRNIKNIHYSFSNIKIKTYPHMNFLELYIIKFLKLNIEFIEPLNLINYKKKDAINILKNEFDWKEYEDKHFESFFTKFYQAYILPNKFNVDKRKAHLSCLIRNNEISRQECLEILKKPPYVGNIDDDKKYFCKKLDFSLKEFDDIMKLEPISHNKYKNSETIFNIFKKIFLYFNK